MMLRSFIRRAALALTAGALLAGGPTAFAQQKLVAPQSEIGFVSKQMGVPVAGHFRKFDAQLAFNPAQPAAGKVTLAIDTASATLGVPETDAELPKAVWFNVAKFPTATFESSAIRSVGQGRYEVVGTLAIKGSKQDVQVPVTLAQSGDLTTATGQFSIKRLAFKIGENEWADTSMVADDVQVKFKLVFTGVPQL